MRGPWMLVALMVSLSLAGCLEGPTVDSGGQGNTTADELVLPAWDVGDQWLYTFSTPQFGEDSARLVVAEVSEDDGLYRLGISSEREAQRHAVINHNPFLGRITMDALSVYEQGEAQLVFNFPWEVGQTWTFTLLGQAWTAETTSIYNGVADVVAQSDEGHRLTYGFSGREGFLESLVWTDSDSVEQLRMTLNQAKSGYEGDVHFYQARDLLDSMYEQNDNDLYDSFLDSGHPDGEDFLGKGTHHGGVTGHAVHHDERGHGEASQRPLGGDGARHFQMQRRVAASQRDGERVIPADGGNGSHGAFFGRS